MPLMLWHGVPCLKGVTPQSKDAGRLQALWQPYPTSREPERDKAVGPPPRSLSSLTVILPMPASRHPSPLGNMHQLHPTLPRVNLTAPPPRARTLMLHRTVKVTHGGQFPNTNLQCHHASLQRSQRPVPPASATPATAAAGCGRGGLDPGCQVLQAGSKRCGQCCGVGLRSGQAGGESGEAVRHCLRWSDSGGWEFRYTYD